MLSPEVRKDELVEHLNRNITRLYSWQSTAVKIRASGFPMSLDGTIAVESPRNFRVRAKFLTSEEADFGSSQEQFWFWMRRSEIKNVITVKHEDAEQAQQVLQLPFEPDWLMQALGVIPLVPDEFSLIRPDLSSTEVRLVSEHTTAREERIQKVLYVDTCLGRITRQVLYDSRNRLVAQAVFGNHELDPETGITMPHLIQLDWPQAEMSLRLKIGPIDVNPLEIPEQAWELRDVPGYPRIDLGEQISKNRNRSQNPRRDD
ncbi:MAG: hypothetical protein CMJ48_13225 [Planctomycetaceae bacterium]|nr:hypothetical protein [Planctomycetaceae bacterium]